ncbi:MAG TPA: LysE family transporter [Chitinophagaceae bacterium]|nr:LysE family transporter [Chitinophagaceae bacterium]
MHPLVKIFLTGMLVSFLGSLPLGTLNIAAMQISVTDGVRNAMLFSLGSLLVEIIYVRLSLVAMDWVRKQEKIFKILEWVTLGVVVALAFSSFYAALHPSVEKNVVLSSSLPKFFLGMAMCAVNPVQIPFWFGWSTVLFTKKILLARNDHYNTYIIGIGLGTFIGNCLFIFGGLLIAGRINNNQHILNWVIGGIFLVTAIFQAWKIIRKKDAHHQLEHPEEVTQKIGDQFEKFEEGLEKMTHKDKEN